MAGNALTPKGALRKLSKTLDRIELAEALSTSIDPREQALSLLLKGRDPETGLPYHEKVRKDIDKLSIGNLCGRCGVTYRMVITAFRDYKRMEAVVGAARRLPNIVQDIAIDAESHEVTCAACEGMGKVTITKTDAEGRETSHEKRCIPCEGIGKVRQMGDKDARKMILEMVELTGRGVMNINAPNSNIVAAGGDSLEDVLKSARKAQTQKEQKTLDAGDDEKVM